MEKSIFDPNHQSNNLDAKIIVALERIAEVFRASLWNVGKEHKLSPLQIQLLIFLKYHKLEQCKVSYLAREFNLSKPTISEAIRTLSKKEFIEKITDPIDTRSYAVKLTESGETMATEVNNYANQMVGAVSNWGNEEQELFYLQLLQLINNFYKMDLIQVQRSCFQCRFYERNGEDQYCNLLKVSLSSTNLRTDCPEFEVATK